MTTHKLPMVDSGARDADKPLLLLVSSLDRHTREYMMESAKQYCRLWLFTDHAPTWELLHIEGHTVVDTLDAEAMVSASELVPASGVLCWDETRVLAAARLAKARGMAGADPDSVRNCRDKLLTRQAASANPTSQVSSRAVATLAEAKSAASTIGYPVVLKPRALSSSFGASVARAPSELPSAFQLARSVEMAEVPVRFDAPVLVEEFLEGPEISVDALCLNYKVDPLFVARKQLGYSPYFEEIGHSVAADDPLLRDPALRDALTAVHSAVGISTGWTHSEWRLTSHGPALVEINARSGGGMIPYLGRLATGIDFSRTAVDLALDRVPTIKSVARGAAAVRFLYPPADCTVKRIEIDYPALPTCIKLVELLADPGDVLLLPPTAPAQRRYCMILATGNTAQECSIALDRAEIAVNLFASPVRRETHSSSS